MPFFFKQKPTKDLKVSDIRGRELPAVTVFAYAIKYFKDHLLHHVEWAGFGTLKNDDICWVLTVPAIWDNRAKFFMREAAIEVSIINTKNMNLNLKNYSTLMCYFSYTRQVFVRISLLLHWNLKLHLSTANNFLLKDWKAQTQTASSHLGASTLF